MRVAHVIKVTRISGAERHLLVLLSALRQRDVDAHLLILVEADKPMTDMVSAAKDRGIPLRRLTIHRDYDLTLLFKIRRVLRQIKPDIVHTHLIHADLYGLFAAKLAGIRTVISSRHNDDQFRFHPMWRRISPALWRLTSGGIAISAAIRDFMIEVEAAPDEKINVVQYGLEHKWIADEELRAARRNLSVELRLDSDALLLGMVCRIVEQKGIPYALRAFRQIRDRFPTANLIIAGDGDLRPQLEALARELGIDANVHWLGWRGDALKLIGAFDTLLMPSLWEGFGLVLLEAMSRRVPVIANRVSAIPEVVAHGQTGLLVEPRDVDALAAAMARLLEDHALRQHMGLLGAARLEERFNVERMVSGTVAVYKGYTRQLRR
ncbi:MAG: glycosyltransferase [Chloroflexi bacterium]|nr:glycosyltransferase [Chloroflexota bacterium]